MDMLWKKIGYLTYWSIVSLKKIRQYVVHSTHTFDKNTFSNILPAKFGIFLGLNLKVLIILEYMGSKKWGRKKVFISCRWCHLWVNLSKSLSIESNQATFTEMLITLEPFELGHNVRPFWNPEKEGHTKIIILSS